MPIQCYEFGSTAIAKVRDSNELRQLLVDPWFESETIIIKPNWVSTEPADFIDAETMRTLFEALDSRIVVTESHMILRSMNLHAGGRRFAVGDKEVNWKWLLKGDGWNWLVENPDWQWFKEGGHWDQIKEEEQVFLEKYGFADLFREFGVTYINVTEEIWNGRVADPDNVKRSVEARFKPLQSERLYSMVPQKLYKLRGSTFISLAKLKSYASFTMKNLFGMIPDPLRPWWHGPKGSRITTSIVDINKIYHSLFNVYGICEALFSTSVPHPEGKFQGVYTGKYNVIDGPGVVFVGRDLVSLDAMLLHLTEGSIVVSPSLNRAPIELAEKEFGNIDREALEEGKMKVGSWLSIYS
jgi:uncharacterized protein (DUF362 family)